MMQIKREIQPLKTSLRNHRSLLTLAASALLALVPLDTGHAVNVAISGFQDGGNQPIADFFNTHFQDVTVTLGDYANPANIPAGTDVLVIGRRLFSGDYGNAANTAVFHNLTIPVIVMTSYVARPDSDRWGLHSGPAVGGGSVLGDETTVTAAGSGVFGLPAGPVDWWSGNVNFDAAGSGNVGEGEILATIGGNILAALWEAGDLTGGDAILGGPRLLFNLPEVGGSGSAAFIPDTPAGIQALANAISATTGLVQIPEPSGVILMAGGLGCLVLRRRRAA